MKFRALLCVAVVLATCRASGRAADAPLRLIEIAELHRKVDPVLLANLSGPPDVAARAALAVGRTKDPAGAAALRVTLDRHDDAVRAMAAFGLGLLEDGPSLERLRSMARFDPNSAVRYAAADAVGRIVEATPALGTRPVGADVLAVARADADPVVRAHAVAALAAFAATPLAPNVARALERIESRDPNAEVRWHAAWALYRGYAALADETFLVRASRDRNELVRVETLRAIGRRGDARLTPAARAAQNDASWRVQLEAREALKRLAKTPPTEHLTAMPPGIHLPAVASAACAVANVAAVPPKPKTAPPPATFPLPSYVPATTAALMNGPQIAKHPRVEICTSRGPVVVRLYPEWAPSTVANFIALARSGYFDGNRWFRIVPDFVVQTGDPTNTGDGDAGYTIPAEENPVEQRIGVIAMGLDYKDSKAVRDSAGTQFYVTLSPQLHLDRSFTVFGEIESGFDVLANLIESDTMTVVRPIADD